MSHDAAHGGAPAVGDAPALPLPVVRASACRRSGEHARSARLGVRAQDPVRAEVDQLIQAAEAKGGEDGGRMATLLEILYGRLARLGAGDAASFRCRARPHVLVVRGKGEKDRMVPLSDPARAAIVRGCMSVPACWRRELALPVPVARPDGHLTRQRFAQLLKEAALAAGLDPARVSPHVLRHAFASHLLKAGPICAVCN